MSDFKIKILAADHAVYQGDCSSVVVPISDGQYGIMAGHINSIMAIVPGKMTYTVPGEETQILAVSEGMVKIEDGEVLILVDSAERPEEIDINRARAEKAAARERLLQKQSLREYKEAEAQLIRATNRLKIKNL